MQQPMTHFKAELPDYGQDSWRMHSVMFMNIGMNSMYTGFKAVR